MTKRLYRTQILLELEQHRALVDIAAQEGRSVSELVREMLNAQLEQRERPAEADKQRQLAALERIRLHREGIQRRNDNEPLRIDVVEMINQMREEQDARNLG
ncbi:MAG: ribbon-helix-helix protein, CopG family [Chloroflexia bacterium]